MVTFFLLCAIYNIGGIVVPKVSLDNLKPGMLTARPVVNSNGMILLGENTELTNELIEKFKNMGVEGVFVSGSSKPTEPLENAVASLDNRFRNVSGAPLMDIIRRATRAHIEGLYE